MNELVVPPAPHWYKSSVVACSPDNTLVYGSKSDIIVIKEKNPEEPLQVQIIHDAHSKYITSIGLNRKWKEPHSYVVSLGEDSVVKVWNLESLEKKITNKDHTEHKEAVIGAVFAGDDRVVSAASHGLIIVWNINTNESKPLKDLFKSRVTLTCLSSCPHAGWLLAFGLSNGCVVIADLRRNGQVLYNLRGHYQAVVSLSWCPAPVNVFPRNPNSKVKNKSLENDSVESDQKIENDKEKKVNPWVNLVHADDGEVPPEKELVLPGVQDFLKECDHLITKILGLDTTLEQTQQTKDKIIEDNEEIRIEETERHEKAQNRPFPKLFDPSGDFLDDSGLQEDNAGNEESAPAQDISENREKSKGQAPEIDEEVASEPKEVSADDAEIEKVEEKKSAPAQDILENQEKSKGQTPEVDEEVASEPKDVSADAADISEDRGNNTEQTPEMDEEVASEPKEGSAYVAEEKKLEARSALAQDISEDRGHNTEQTPERDEEVAPEQTEVSADEKAGEKKLEAGSAPAQVVSEDREKDTSEIDAAVASEQKDVVAEIETAKEEDEPSQKPAEIVEEEPRTEYLLASSGKDRSIYIWRAGTDGRMQTSFNVLKRSGRREKTPNSFIAVCWVAPDIILTSSAAGDILAWPLPKPKEANKQYKVIHNEHSSLVFNIVSPPKYTTAYNWRDSNVSTIWTWAQEGKLINYDMNAQKIRFSYLTMSSMITCFGSSPLDPNRLAIGLRDGGIRVWDLSLPHTNIVKMQTHQQKVTNKISAIGWHPLKETILGFGTEEGRVGFIDLVSRKSTLFPHYFRNQVHKVEWGPINGNTNNLGLYVVAEGKISIYDLQTPDEDPIQLELPEKLYIYKFAWKPDFTLLLLNGKDGSLVVLKTDLVAVTTIYPNEKGLNGIVWHPDAFTDKTDISRRCNWFAATTTKGALVFDCDSIAKNDFADNVVAVFEGHVRPPLALAWCPFEGNKIVSTAADGLAHVWDVTTKSVIATFVDHPFSHNTAVVWSPIDPDLIIMGDKVLRIWSISGNPPKIDEEFLAARKRLVGKTTKGEVEKGDRNKIKVDIPAKSKNPKNCIVPTFYVSNDENISVQIANMRKLMNEDHQQGDGDAKALDPLQLFGTKEQVTQLLEANYSQQNKEGKHKSCEMISLWKGNVGEHIQNAINENRVTPSIITLAPMVSSKLWQDACLTYAKKLSEESDSDPLQIAMYFLACHKVEEAINCLCLNSMFREALALAKRRLPESSDIITKIVEKWAEHCIQTGNFENAAFCYISNKNYEDAAKVLARRNHKEFLEFALELAEKAGNKGLCDSIKFKYGEVQGPNGVLEQNVLSRIEALMQNLGENDEKSGSSTESQSDIGTEELLNSVELIEENQKVTTDEFQEDHEREM